MATKATVKVRSFGTGETLELSSADAQEALARGTVELEDDEVKVVSGDNQSGTVSRADAPEAFAQGWRLASDAEAEQSALRREASGAVGTVQGSAEALLRGASVGLSDVAIDALGGDAKRMRARQEALGDIATGLEVGGAVAASVLTGGGGAAAQGAARGTAMGTARALAARGAAQGWRAAAAPTRLATRAGDAVAGAIAGSEATFGRQIVSRFAGGGVEGAIGGLGGVVSESVLTEKDLTAEALLGGLVAGAVFGGGLDGAATATVGGLARGTAAAASKVASSSSAAFARLRSGAMATRDSVRKVLSRDTGMAEQAVPDVLVDAALKEPEWINTLARTAAWSGADPVLYKRALTAVNANPKRVQDVFNRKGEIEAQIGETLQAQLNTVRDTLGEARKRAQGEGKYSSLAGKLPDHADDVSARLADTLRTKVRGQIDKWKTENAGSSMLAYDAAAMHQLDKLWQRLDAESMVPGEKAALRGPGGRFMKKPPEDPGMRAMARYRGWDRFKRDIDVLIDQTGGWGAPKEGASLDEIAANGLLRQLHRETRDFLEREDLWGDAAIHQREINATFAKSARATAEFQKIATGSGLRGLFDPNSPISQRQAITVARQFRRMGGDEVVSKFDQVLDAQLEHLDTIVRHYDLGREERMAIQHAKDAVKDIRERLAQQADDAELLDIFQSLRDAESNSSVSMGLASTVGPALGAAIGAGVAGPLGAAVGLAAGSLLRPYTTARTLASLLSLKDRFKLSFDAQAFVKKMSEGADKVRARAKAELAKLTAEAKRAGRQVKAGLERAGKGVVRAGKGATVGGALQAGQGGSGYRTTSDRQLELAQLADRVSQLGTYEDLRRELGPEWEVLAGDMPELAGKLEVVLQRAVAYLDQHRPPVLRRPYSGRPPIVDPVAATRFERRYEAVTQPERVLRRLEDGTLTLEHVDALRSVYPLHYQGLVDGLTEALAKADAMGWAPRHRDRVRLGILLGQALDAALEPGHRLAMERVYGPARGPGTTQGVSAGAALPASSAAKLRGPGVDRLSFDRLDTPATVTASGRLRA